MDEDTVVRDEWMKRQERERQLDDESGEMWKEIQLRRTKRQIQACHRLSGSDSSTVLSSVTRVERQADEQSVERQAL